MTDRQLVYVRREGSILEAELLKENKKSYSVFIKPRGFHIGHKKLVNKEDVIFTNEKFVLVFQSWKIRSVFSFSCRIERNLYPEYHDFPGEYQPKGFTEYHDPALKGAVVKSSDATRYFENQMSHRLDGAAIECKDGRRLWYYYGEYINVHNQEDFEKHIKTLCLS